MLGYERHLTTVPVLAGVIVLATVVVVPLGSPIPFLDG